jgi:hypothetical protein
MADAPISYAIVAAVFAAFGAICFGARNKRLSGQKLESPVDTSNENEIKRSPA